MSFRKGSLDELRGYRNGALYRPLARVLRIYNRTLIDGLHARGFVDFTPAFPQILSNLDLQGTRIGILADRAGITRQAAGQLVAEIERCGYVERRPAEEDGRAVIVRFTPRGRKLLENVFDLVDATEARFAGILGKTEFDRMRRALAELANRIDPQGAFGAGDED